MREVVVELQVINVIEVGSNLFIWSLRGRRLGPAAEGTKGDAVPIMSELLIMPASVAYGTFDSSCVRSTMSFSSLDIVFRALWPPRIRATCYRATVSHHEQRCSRAPSCATDRNSRVIL